jgi:hypothetical protein
VMFNEADNVVLLRGGDQGVVVCEELGCGFCDKDVNSTLNRVDRDTVVGA